MTCAQLVPDLLGLVPAPPPCVPLMLHESNSHPPEEEVGRYGGSI